MLSILVSRLVNTTHTDMLCCRFLFLSLVTQHTRTCSAVVFLFLSLSVVLEMTADLPAQSVLDRWVGEPVKAVIVSTKVFLTNKKGFPTLSRRHQDFATAMIK